MRLLADENFPKQAVEGLRVLGHDVFWVRTSMSGASDEAVLERAQEESRLVVTMDKDFGELAFRWGLPADSGVVLLRRPLLPPEEMVNRLINVLSSGTEWSGFFAVVEADRVRIRPLPRPVRG